MNTVTEKSEEAKLVAPSIGAEWQGGIYIGILGGIDGQPDCHIVVSALQFHLHDFNWKNSMDAASTATLNEFSDWSLIDRRESRLAAINAPSNFRTDVWYWTSTQYAGYSDYAWVQNFNNGYQDYYRKSNEYSAAFVRRIPII